MSWDWHKRVVPVVVSEFKPDVFVHDIYTPNLMLESRWWYDAIHTKSRAQAESEWRDIERLYKGIDDILGETMKNADDDTLVVFSSDHGVCHLKRLVKLNNLFAKKGWLKFSVDPKTGEAAIDWKNTKVIFLKMMNIYVNPKGLEGNWKRGSGPEYEKLRGEVLSLLRGLKDSDGKRPLQEALVWEEAQSKHHLPADRIGDIVLEAALNYFWYEEVDKKGEIFVKPKTSGYKQSIDPEKNQCMWTPVVFWGKGVKHAHQIANPIRHRDQLPTILKLMDKEIPPHVQGAVLQEILEP
jgi:predicted AlkP superfamily phosphohydrolase/phosphomutase